MFIIFRECRMRERATLVMFSWKIPFMHRQESSGQNPHPIDEVDGVERIPLTLRHFSQAGLSVTLYNMLRYARMCSRDKEIIVKVIPISGM